MKPESLSVFCQACVIVSPSWGFCWRTWIKWDVYVSAPPSPFWWFSSPFCSSWTSTWRMAMCWWVLLPFLYTLHSKRRGKLSLWFNSFILHGKYKRNVRNPNFSSNYIYSLENNFYKPLYIIMLGLLIMGTKHGWMEVVYYIIDWFLYWNKEHLNIWYFYIFYI